VVALFARNRARQGPNTRLKREREKTDEIIESAVKIIEREQASRCLPERGGIQSRGTPAKNRDNAPATRETERGRDLLVLRYILAPLS